MPYTPEMQAFIIAHASDNTDKLLLSAKRFPEIDVPYAVEQILARRQIKEKIPSWYAVEGLVYPSRLSTEQCSSEQTARYKQQLLKGNSLCDLTGGLGVDCFYLSQQARTATYIERFPNYCEAARHNFSLLGAEHIQVVQADVREIFDTLKADTFYIDPARRTQDNKRAFALADCEPDIVQLKDTLLKNAGRLIVKISPMADLEETLRLLPETVEIHILAVKNECKELLFLLENTFTPPEKVKIVASNLQPNKTPSTFQFYLQEEKEASLITAERPESYLYEPHTALLKSGAFKLTAIRYRLKKLHRHSHLYTSSQRVPDFPGRCFKIEEVIPFSAKQLKQIAKEIPQANLTVRNFPLSVVKLRERTGIKEGGDIYLFASTLANEQKVLLLTHKP